MNVLLLLGSLALLGADDPFVDLGHEAARAKALAENKLLFIDFTAEWCGPCKHMDRDTWADPGVRSWLAEHAIAIQIDVDEESEVARRFEVEAMPTVLALRGGEEFDRSIGYLDAEGFLKWARDVRAGKRSVDAILEREKALRESGDVDARYDLARSLLQHRRYDLALEHYLWLWPATRDTSYDGVRLSFMLADVQRLMEAHEPARKAFLEILDEIQGRIVAAEVPTFHDWQEWTALCGHFGMTDRVLKWYETRRDAEGRLYPEIEGGHLVDLIRNDLFDLLLENDRPFDAVRLLPDPVVWMRGRVAFYVKDESLFADMDEEQRAGILEFTHKALRDEAGRVYAALLLADRTGEAEQVARVLIGALDTPDSRIALVRAGLRAGRTSPSCARWLDEAEASGARVRSLRRRIEELELHAAGGGLTWEDLEQLTLDEIWRMGVERFGWRGDGPTESKAQLIRHFLQDQRIEDWGHSDDDED